MGEQRAAVPLGERAALEVGLHLGGEPEEPERVTHRRAVLADQPRHLLLRQRELRHQPLVPHGGVERGEVVALEVLDQREGEQRPVVGLLHHRGDLGPPQPLHRAPAALPGDQLVAPRRAGPHHHRLEEARRGDRIGQLAELRLVEVAPRLVRVGADRGHRELPQRTTRRRILPRDRSQQRLEAAAQPFRFGHEPTSPASRTAARGRSISALSSPDSARRSNSWATER